MARYRGLQSRISRRFGEPIFGPDKVLERKNYPAGHMEQIKEEVNNLNMVFSYKKNKKAKFTYGILENNFLIFLRSF